MSKECIHFLGHSVCKTAFDMYFYNTQSTVLRSAYNLHTGGKLFLLPFSE